VSDVAVSSDIFRIGGSLARLSRRVEIGSRRRAIGNYLIQCCLAKEPNARTRFARRVRIDALGIMLMNLSGCFGDQISSKRTDFGQSARNWRTSPIQYQQKITASASKSRPLGRPKSPNSRAFTVRHPKQIRLAPPSSLFCLP
jgi:hypothetical protein